MVLPFALRALDELLGIPHGSVDGHTARARDRAHPAGRVAHEEGFVGDEPLAPSVCEVLQGSNHGNFPWREPRSEHCEPPGDFAWLDDLAQRTSCITLLRARWSRRGGWDSRIFGLNPTDRRRHLIDESIGEIVCALDGLLHSCGCRKVPQKVTAEGRNAQRKQLKQHPGLRYLPVGDVQP